MWPFISCAARCSHPGTEIKPPLFRLSNPLYCCSYDSLVHTAAGLSAQGTAQWILSSSRSLWVGERCHKLSRIRRRVWDRRSWSACGPHLGRLYTCLSAKVELIDLSLKLVKPCAHSFVDISSNRARRDRNSESDRRKSALSTLVDNARVRYLLVVRGASRAL